MSVSNIILNINDNSFIEKDNSNNQSNEIILNDQIKKEDISTIKNTKSQRKSPSKGKKKKKKKKNRHIRIICRNKKIKKSNSELKSKTPKKDVSKNNTKINDSSDGKVLTKIYLAQLIKKKKMYSEKVKLMKIIKRHSSAKIKENSSIDIIKQYSQQVYKTNKAAISIQKEREIEKEKEQKKEILELLRIKNNNLLKSEDLNNSNDKLKQLPSSFLRNNLINLSNNNNLSKLKSNKRYLVSQNTELRRCQSDGIEEYVSNKFNNNIKSFKTCNNQNNLIKIQINNNTSQNNIFKKEKLRVKSPINNSQSSCDRFSKIRQVYQKQDVKESLKDFNRLYYLILPGNASYLIKNCMCHRTNWREAFCYATNLFNFKWQQLSNGIDYIGLGKYGSIKQLVNHFENHYSISNKANMFVNLMNYCEQRKMSVFKYVPFTIIFEFNPESKQKDKEKEKLYEENLEQLKMFIDGAEKFVTNFNNIGKYYNEVKFIEEKKNRNEFFKEKKKKKRRYYKYYDIEEENEEDIKVYNGEYIVYRDYFKRIKLFEKITISNNLDLYEKEKERKKKLEKTIGTNTVIEIPDTHYNGKNMWVIKAINLNRGMCIQIVNNFNQMCTVLNKFKEGVDYNFTEKVIDENQNEMISKEKKDNEEKVNKENKEDKSVNNKKNEIEEEKNNNNGGNNSQMYYCSRIIIQKYIECPLLYKSRKCDMRIWVLITHNMKVYFFKEGHLKTCSIEYDINSKDAFRHITNYSFQKYNENFQKFEKGNEVPFYEFQKFIDENYPEKNYKLNKDLVEQIKEIVSITTKSVKEQINKNERNYQFEIFGYDFMLDSNFNLFLIEINTNPGIEESSPWIKVIVPRMLDDALRLTLDQLFNPKYDFNKIYKNEEETNNMKLVLNNLKNEIDPNAPESVGNETINNNSMKVENNKSDDNIEKNENNSYNCCKTEVANSSNLSETENQKKEIKIDNNKSGKYASPFPVPGYRDDENLWEFVCDLNGEDPLDKYMEKEETKKQEYTGIKYLFNKKNKNKKEKNEEKKIIIPNVSNSSIENNEESKDKDKNKNKN